MIHLCKTCHAQLTKPLSVYPQQSVYGVIARFCNEPHKRQFNKLSLEEKRAAHWQWVREEAIINDRQNELF